MSAILLSMLIYVIFFSKSSVSAKEINDEWETRELKRKWDELQREIRISDYLNRPA